jgi:hypothetical protein
MAASPDPEALARALDSIVAQLATLNDHLSAIEEIMLADPKTRWNVERYRALRADH